MAQKFEIVFDASMNVGQIKNAVNEMQKSLSMLSLPQNLTTKFSSTIASLSKELDNFERLASKGFETKGDFGQFEKSGRKILDLFDNLKYSIKSLGTLSDKDLERMFPKELVDNIKAAKIAITEYKTAASEQQKEVKKQQANIDRLSVSLQNLKKQQLEWQGKTRVDESGYKELARQTKEAESSLGSLIKRQEELSSKSKEFEDKLKQPKKSNHYRDIQKELNKLIPEIEEAKNKFNNLHNQLNNTTTFNKQKTELDDLKTKIQDLEKQLSESQSKLLNTQSNTSALDNLFTSLEKIDGIDISKFPRTLEGAKQAIDALVSGGIDEAKAKVENFSNTAEKASTPVETLNQNLRQEVQNFKEYDQRVGDISALKQRITYFFGLNNAINLARRAIQNAFNTIKELDKTMTETAVVTDFTVSDMWEQLPEYTKRANELGVATNDAYAAATLYYQQGKLKFLLPNI